MLSAGKGAADTGKGRSPALEELTAQEENGNAPSLQA